ncbi:serine/threonine protein kinase crk1 [Histoplasma capsulatum H143]|uniref:Serine/threonine protein kinase crk1 n=1 Tax=Ajellomyces capsulatus (strain H143) TaxID=544712 RepID=C6HSK3_AJECH|nr:serine/threonine protein kinase crk1 [Histoplasma capsulatum H143]
MGMVFAELSCASLLQRDTPTWTRYPKSLTPSGTPTEENWPGVTRLPNFVPIQENQITPLQGRDFFIRQFPTAGPLGADLLASMLKLDPRKRSTARQVLQHAWWVAEPRPTRNEDLPRKAGGAKKMGDDLVRRGGEIDETRFKDVARQLDFNAMR